MNIHEMFIRIDSQLDFLR